jgi:hypothetical protein
LLSSSFFLDRDLQTASIVGDGTIDCRIRFLPHTVSWLNEDNAEHPLREHAGKAS